MEAQVTMKRRNFSVSRTALLRITRPARVTLLGILVVLLNVAGTILLQGTAEATGGPLSGEGSSFAAPALQAWDNVVDEASRTR
jgi:ABC-type phosphate transport system substrate-binding protein